MSTLPNPAGGPAQVTVVELPGCHYCAEARETLERLAASGAVAVTRVDALLPLGKSLMQQHRAAMSPLVLVDGAYFSQGRLPRGKLARLLELRHAAATQEA